MQKQDQHYVIEFDRLEKSLNGMASSPVHGVRKEAIARFSTLGFPTTKQEEWRFTNVTPVARTPFEPVLAYDPQGVTRDLVARYSLGESIGGSLVFVNGHWAREFSRIPKLPEGIEALISFERQANISTCRLKLRSIPLPSGYTVMLCDGIPCLRQIEELLLNLSDRFPFFPALSYSIDIQRVVIHLIHFCVSPFPIDHKLILW